MGSNMLRRGVNMGQLKNWQETQNQPGLGSSLYIIPIGVYQIFHKAHLGMVYEIGFTIV